LADPENDMANTPFVLSLSKDGLFFCVPGEEQGQCFDKLSTNGIQAGYVMGADFSGS